MKITETAIDAIKEYEKNAKTHTKKQIKNIAESIKQFGFTQPIATDRDGVIIIGHGRYKAAQLLGLKTVPTVIMDELTEEQTRKLRILDNKLNESPWDTEALFAEINDIDFSEFDLDFGTIAQEEETTGETGGEEQEEDTNPYDLSEKTPGALTDRFIVPPFSVLDARTKQWRKRSAELAEDHMSGIDPDEISEDPLLLKILINWFTPQDGMVAEQDPQDAIVGEIALTDGFDYGKSPCDFYIAINPDENTAEELDKNLKDDRFAALIFRGQDEKREQIREQLEDKHIKVYNELIVLLPITATAGEIQNEFNTQSTFHRVHTTVLVFYKGNPKKIKETNYKFIGGEEQPPSN